MTDIAAAARAKIEEHVTWIETLLNDPDEREFVSLLLGTPDAPNPDFPQGRIRFMAGTDAELKIKPNPKATPAETAAYQETEHAFRDKTARHFARKMLDAMKQVPPPEMSLALRDVYGLHDASGEPLVKQNVLSRFRSPQKSVDLVHAKLTEAVERWSAEDQTLVNAAAELLESTLSAHIGRNNPLRGAFPYNSIPNGHPFLTLQSYAEYTHTARYSLNLADKIMLEAAEHFPLRAHEGVSELDATESPTRLRDMGEMLEARLDYGPAVGLVERYGSFQAFVQNRAKEVGGKVYPRVPHVHWSFGNREEDENVTVNQNDDYNMLGAITAIGASRLGHRLFSPFLGNGEQPERLVHSNDAWGNSHLELRHAMNSRDVRAAGIRMNGLEYNMLAVVCGIRLELERLHAQYRHAKEQTPGDFTDAFYHDTNDSPAAQLKRIWNYAYSGAIEHLNAYSPEDNRPHISRRMAIRDLEDSRDGDLGRLLGDELLEHIISRAKIKYSERVASRQTGGAQRTA